MAITGLVVWKFGNCGNKNFKNSKNKNFRRKSFPDNVEWSPKKL